MAAATEQQPHDSQAADGATGAAEGEEIEEIAELQYKEEERLEKLFEEQRRERGLDDEVTLKTFFKLFDMWIQLYRLNKCREALEEIVPICRRRGGQLHVQGVQALAFTLWKQMNFREAIKLFHEIEETVGASSALCENMGHTYSSMGDYDQASKYFEAALLCMDHEKKLGKKIGDRGGVLLGLGLIEDRRGCFEKALLACREAQTLFRARAAGKPSSLVAKAGMSIAKILLKLALKEGEEENRIQMEEEAIEREVENVALFEVTCGLDSPLTASALKGLGEALLRRRRFQEAINSFSRSYLLEAQKDAFDLLSIMEVHNCLFGAHMEAMRDSGGPLDRAAFREHLPTIVTTLERVRAMTQDANAGAYYKVAGEMRAFAEDYVGASELLGQAIVLFQTEEKEKVDSLISNCKDLKEFCDTQSSPAAAAAAAASTVGNSGLQQEQGHGSEPYRSLD